ncbi:uncharacterized protein KIAA1614-like [Parambassis ranga]|uniref:Uncharacterized protein KIAA1614-like n=1 Tax=Parambassis ranga TaxID=210632 RepID=A0A6P7I338_9TELE|nr:uncharacterized protein KIAA1614-like [Parambassis ranga]
MKRRRFPLKGDHNLLTPDTHTLSGVRQEPSGCVALLSGHPSNPCAAASRSTRQHQGASPNRRLRFEDETEMEAETRYLERLRRPGGPRGTGVLVAKPDLHMYINGRKGVWLKDVRHVVDMQQNGRIAMVGTHQSDSQTLLGGGVGLDLNLQVHPPVTDRGRNLSRYSQVRTEPIRETYIGTVTLSDTSRGNGRVRQVSHMQVRRSASHEELQGSQVTVLGTSATDLPINPYAPHMATPSPASFLGHPLSQNDRLSGTKAEPDLNQNQKESCPCVKERDVKSTMKNSSSSSSSSLSGKSSETTAENQTPAASHSSDGQPHSDKAPPVEHFSSRDDSSRLSLRHLFSTVRLSRARTGSLDRFSTKACNSDSDLGPSGNKKSSSLLKKSPSVQSLSMGSPILQLKKSSSVHSFGSEQKKSKDRSADYRPADQFLQRCLSVKDVSHPCSARAVGRVLQVCSDGTIVLELNQPMGRTYGFIISRGKGRPDSGVYVEDMGDSNTAKLYAGLLAVGDEILEVNGEKVASLSLDQVTYLLAQNPSTAVRVLRHRKTSSR